MEGHLPDPFGALKGTRACPSLRPAFGLLVEFRRQPTYKRVPMGAQTAKRVPFSTFIEQVCRPALFGVATLAWMLSWSEPVFAQSAADKATARELASDGVRLLNAGDAASALNKLEKAQALYDAPIHLLYLGRAHVALGQFVEGAESYRSLARVKLDADAPPAFRQAQIDGAQELKKVEPRIGKLTVDVLPKNVEELRVRIDGRPVNTAALGVPRASNPGVHVILVEAYGYETAEATVDVLEGKSAEVQLELVALSEDELPSQEARGQDEKKDSAGAEWSTGPMGLIAGIKIGGVMPLGQLEQDVPMSDFFGPGVGGRVDLGFRFVKHLGVKFYLSGAVFEHGSKLEEHGRAFPKKIKSVILASQGELGASLLFTSDPRKLGGFGELGMGIVRGYGWMLNYNKKECRDRANYTGWGARAGGGVNVPFGKLFTLVPTADVTVGQLGRRATEYECSNVVAMGPDYGPEKMNKALHVQIFFGIGGDFHFGDDWFR